MNIKNSECGPSEDNMCKSCHLFYAAEAFQGLCSSCFKKNKTNKKQQTQVKLEKPLQAQHDLTRKQTVDDIQVDPIEPQVKPQKDRKRCYDCNKKVGLLGVECKCGFIFCNTHRLPQDHTCNFNHQQEARKKLQKQIVKVYNGKISDI